MRGLGKRARRVQPHGARLQSATGANFGLSLETEFFNSNLDLCSARAIDCTIIKPVGSSNSFRGYPKKLFAR